MSKTLTPEQEAKKFPWRKYMGRPHAVTTRSSDKDKKGHKILETGVNKPWWRQPKAEAAE